jgi:hypothetical protein
MVEISNDENTEENRMAQKFSVELPQDPADPVDSGDPPKSIESGSQRCLYTVFVAVLSTVATCPLTHEWVNRMWYIHTMEYYSALKSKKFQSPNRGNKLVTKVHMQGDSST